MKNENHWKLMLEVLNKLEEAPKPGSAEDAVKVDTKGKGSSTAADLFDIDMIVGRLTATTETEEGSRSGQKNVSDSFATIRGIIGIDSAPIRGADVINVMKKMFMHRESNDDGTLGGFTSEKAGCAVSQLQQETTKIILTTALLDIFKNFNASAAGFVNEQFVANLLDGEVVTTNSTIDISTKRRTLIRHIVKGAKAGNVPWDLAEDWQPYTSKGSPNNIADLELGGDRHGISLKTKASGIKGSIRDLMSTMGVRWNRIGKIEAMAYDESGDHLIPRKGKTWNTKTDEDGNPVEFYVERQLVFSSVPNSGSPVYQNLSYLLFGKPTQGSSTMASGDRKQISYWRMYCWDVSAQSIVDGIKADKNAIEGTSHDGQPCLEFTADSFIKAGKTTSSNLFLTYTGADYSKLAGMHGIDGSSPQANTYLLNIDNSQEDMEAIAGSAGEGIRKSLEDLNRYFGLIQGAVMSYALTPTRENANKLKDDLKFAKEFGISKINNDNC